MIGFARRAEWMTRMTMAMDPERWSSLSIGAAHHHRPRRNVLRRGNDGAKEWERRQTLHLAV